MKHQRIGFIGLGIMGAPMAEHLVNEGYEVLVNDINEKAVERLVRRGAIKAAYQEIGRSCETILLILPNGEIVNNVLFQEKGVASSIQEGCVICDLSSITPEQSRQYHQKISEMGGYYVDAPVSGGEPGAIEGTLAIMAGGDPRAVDRLRPILGAFSHSVTYLGESGSGSIAKLANQIIVNLNILALSEALVFAQKAGANPRLVASAIRGGLAGSAVLDAKAEKICDRDFVAGGKISINAKDIKNVLETAHAIGAPVPFTAQLYEIQQTMKVQGRLDEDHCAYVKYFEQLADVVVGKDEGEEL